MPQPNGNQGLQFTPTGLGDERLCWYRPEGMDGVEILAAEDSPRLWRVYHETYSFCTISKKSPTASLWRYRKADECSSTNNLMCVEPGEIHYMKKIVLEKSISRNISQKKLAGTFRALFISSDSLRTFAYKAGAKSLPHIAVANPRDPVLVQAFRDFHTAVETGRSTMLEQDSLLTYALATLLQKATETPLTQFPSFVSDTALRRVKDYIHENCYEKIPLTKLADIAETDKFRLLRSFKKQFGAPPHTYQNLLRVSKIRCLLDKKSTAPLWQMNTGFADESHLIRRFKERFGMTPSGYAKSIQHTSHFALSH